MMTLLRGFLAAGAATLILAHPALAANDYEPQLKKALEAKIRPWLADAAILDAVKAQNAAHAALSQPEIDARDKQWRAEAKAGGKGPLVDKVLGNALSAFLKGKKADSKGLIDEVFVTDNKGLNVGQSDVTSDYWQGDEPKWQKSFGLGASGIIVEDVEYDESTKTYISQVSVTLVDAAGAPIGAITIGMNVEKLE